MSPFTIDPETSNPKALLADLVGIDSVNPAYGGRGEKGIEDYVASWLAERGIAYRIQPVASGRSNVVARLGPASEPALLLEAHMDTVSTVGWAEGSPFELKERNGRLYGRGACDTKASLACFMLATSFFHRNPQRLKGALVFVASVDEENEQAGAYELAKLKSELGISRAITGEPTRSDVVSKHKGVGRYGIATTGKAAHGSNPELGVNAVYQAARICGELERLGEGLDRRVASDAMEKGTVNLGRIDGGSGFNIVPDRCRLDIDRRFGVLESAAEARAELEAICRREPGSELTVFLERPPLRGEKSASFVSEFLAAAQRAEVNIAERQTSYMTNAVAYESAGIPSVVFGPGDIAQAHKSDEFIAVGEMERSLSILIHLLSR